MTYFILAMAFLAQGELVGWAFLCMYLVDLAYESRRKEA